MIEFACPHCGKRVRTPKKNAGKRAKCTRCANIFSIPRPAPAVLQLTDDDLVEVPAPSDDPLSALAAAAGEAAQENTQRVPVSFCMAPDGRPGVLKTWMTGDYYLGASYIYLTGYTGSRRTGAAQVVGGLLGGGVGELLGAAIGGVASAGGSASRTGDRTLFQLPLDGMTATVVLRKRIIRLAGYDGEGAAVQMDDGVGDDEFRDVLLKLSDRLGDQVMYED